MSTLPYGLRKDPFASPATLSAKEASRLIRRRVGASGGDGAALFPIPACDEIHRLAGGVPDAILALAGRALEVASAAGSDTVSVAHVREAAAAVSPSPPGEPSEMIGEAAPAADPEGPLVPDSIGEAEPGESLIGEAAAAEEPVGGSPRGEDASGDQATPGTPEGEADDSDLPSFRPASFALPTEPSEDLSSDAREWVARFIPGAASGRPVRAASPAARTRGRETPAPARPKASTSDAARGAGAAPRAGTGRRPEPEPRANPEREAPSEHAPNAGGRPEPAPAPVAGRAPEPARAAETPRKPEPPRLRRAERRRANRRARDAEREAAAAAREAARQHEQAARPVATKPAPLPTAVLPPPALPPRRLSARWRAPSRELLTVGAVILILLLVVYYSVRGTPFWYAPEERRLVPTSESGGRQSPAAGVPAPEAGARGTLQPVEPSPGVDPPPAVATPPGEPRTAVTARGAGADSARRATPSRYALEVATFIFEERAKSERARLAAAGYSVRVLSRFEYGSRVYRVVVGNYARPGAAERAADSLLARGLVLQARVITLPAAR